MKPMSADDLTGKPGIIDKLRPELGGKLVKAVAEDMQRAVREKQERERAARKAAKKKAKR